MTDPVIAARRRWVAYLTAIFGVWGATSAFLGALAPEIQASFGLSDADYGAIVAAQALGGLAGGAFGGLARSFGSVRRTLARLLLAATACAAAAAVAPSAIALAAALTTLVSVVVAATALGHGAIGRLAAAPGAVSEVAAVETAFSAGAAVGPPIVVAILAVFGAWSAAFAVAAAAFVLLAAATRLVPSLAEAGAPPESADPAVDRPPAKFVVALIAVGAVGAAVELGPIAWSVLHAIDAVGVSEETARWALTAALTAALVARLALGRVAQHVAPERLLLASAIASAAGFAILLTADGPATLILGNAVVGMATAVHFPATMMVGIARFPSRGNAIAGIMVFGEAFGFAAVGLTVGAAAEAVGLRAAYGLFVVASLMWFGAALWMINAAGGSTPARPLDSAAAPESSP